MDKVTLSIAFFAAGLTIGGYAGDRHGSRTLVGQIQILGCSLTSEDGKANVSWRQRADGTCATGDLYREVQSR